MNCPTVKDGRGNRSVTLTLVLTVFVIGTVKFLAAGTDMPVIGSEADISLNEFGMFGALMVGVWQGREITQKHHERQRDSG